ncbi:hypothetical protein NC652_008064 [Populus alba x Populus x berolinensis]|nr:hypothetical protein NC652_008056 [Populus alba x Populus x berolinensis]KAJ6942140.1 hypothetical protein NC652_008060 [Populus alba x Populus x berolinensis]KAJ6942144.1 hypothetical protein NC652_008064 [Populus alba x Populus x berolinensis]
MGNCEENGGAFGVNHLNDNGLGDASYLGSTKSLFSSNSGFKEPVPESIRANSRCQHDNKCSSNEEDQGDIAGNNRYNQDYCMKVEISSFGDDIGVEEFLNWLAECDLFYKHTGISDSRMTQAIPNRDNQKRDNPNINFPPIKCYRCNQEGQGSKPVNVVEREDEECREGKKLCSEECYEPNSEGEYEDDDDYDGQAYVLRQLLLTPKADDETQ